MDDGTRRVDAFHTISGLLGITAGPILLLRGAPAGWSFLLMAGALVILSVQLVIAQDIEFEVTHRIQILLPLASVVCIAIAIVYLTRAANDLPTLFPGHDGDSEHIYIAPGVVALLVGLVALGRGLASAHPARASH